jgi:serine protease
MSLRLSSTRCALVALPVAGLLIAGVVAAVPSVAAADYTDAGTASAPSPVGFGATDLAFTTSCPDPGPAQGLDGWVFALPADVAVAGTVVSVSGTSADAPVDVSAYVYDDDCGFLRSETSDGALQVTLADTDRYLSVYTTTGSDTSFALTATAGTVVDPSPSASPSPSPSPTSDPGSGTLRTRHTYSASPNDPYFNESGLVSVQGQWGMKNIHAPQAWQQPRATGAGVQVAVLDSGLDLGHPDLSCEGKVRIAPGATPTGEAPQDVDGHGTHVAGIIGACTDNGTGVVGVAPDATLLPFRVLGPEGGTAEDLAKAIKAATDAGAHVINMSIGFGVSDPVVGATVPGSGSAVALAGVFAEIDEALSYATSHGVVVVAASGNESFPLCGYPALADKVVCVGSVDRRDLPAYYGNPPVKADGGTPTEGPALVAPGGSGQVFCDLNSEKVLSTYARDLDGCDEGLDPGYNGLDGTSMASPHVAGVAALVYDRLGAVRSAANADKVVQALEDGAVDLGTPGYDPVFGYGRVDALGAVEAVTPVADPSPPAAAPTRLELTAPAAAQRTDGLDVRAVLTDASGAPVVGQPVQLGITGGPSAQVVTDATGAVTSRFSLDADPGEYELTATYAGTPSLQPSGAHQPLAVLAEDSRTSLLRSGKTAALTATVTDADSPTGVAGVPVAFLADGVQVGTATTDANGVATYTPAKKAKKTYEAKFGGDSRWRPSAATVSAV